MDWVCGQSIHLGISYTKSGPVSDNYQKSSDYDVRIL